MKTTLLTELSDADFYAFYQFVAADLELDTDTGGGAALVVRNTPAGDLRTAVHSLGALESEAERRASLARAKAGPRPALDAARPTTAPRPSWDDLFLDLAIVVARRTTCVRALEAYGGIGAVLVEEDTRHVLGVGYCGSLPGHPHCTDVGCLVVDPVPGCQRSIHAEMNAILTRAPSERPKALYCNVSPCLKCLQHAVVVGVRRVVFGQLYRLHAEQIDLCRAAGVAWVQAR